MIEPEVSPEQQSSTQQLREQFLREVPHRFRRAAKTLEFDEILAAHLRYAHSALGKFALVKELQPKADREKIMLPAKMAWKIDKSQERFVPMATQGLVCAASGAH